MTNSKTPARHRHRASAACIACRKARIRCTLVDKETKICSYCQGNGHRCVFDEKDGRKTRASARAEADKLSARVKALEEQLLREQNAANAEAQKARERAAAMNPSSLDISPPGISSAVVQAHPALQYEEPTLNMTPGNEGSTTAAVPDVSPSSGRGASLVDSSRTAEDDAQPPESVIRRVLPTQIRFDMSSGRVRYFGPTTNLNVLSACSPAATAPATLKRRRSHWPICLVVDIDMETHNYLMDLFWACHNSVIHMVHLDAFYSDQEHGGTDFYSTFLHVTMLATGFRYADKTRPDVKTLGANGAGAGSASSTLHEKARALAKLEINQPGGIPAIQAFALLGGLEFYCDRDDTGWLFTGMAFRMVFDEGLHVDSAIQFSERETEIRHMVLWACIFTDILWSLQLGRPITLKTADISPNCLSFDFQKLVECLPDTLPREKKMGTRIYENLLRLMDIMKQLCDQKPSQTSEAFQMMTRKDHELDNFYRDIPDDLRWPSPQQAIMPGSYFLLHTQYHAALILLHRPFVDYSEAHRHVDMSGDETPDRADNHPKNRSRDICASSAKEISAIFAQYRRRLDVAQVFGTGVQHAGTAATALMGEISLQTNPVEKAVLVDSLSSLHATMTHMSKNYQPAVTMARAVEQFIRGVKASGGYIPDAARPASEPEDEIVPVVAPNGTEVRLAADRVPEYDVAGGSSSRQRQRVDQSFIFTPTGPGAVSPQGIPYLPSSFLENLNMEDMPFLDLSGVHQDYNFSWETYPNLS